MGVRTRHAVVRRRGPAATAGRGQRDAGAVADGGRPTGDAWPVRAAEALLDGAVVVLATWTLVYHLCLVLRLSVAWAVTLETLALAVVVTGVVLRRRRGAADAAAQESGLAPPAARGPRRRPWRPSERLLAGAATAAAVAAAWIAALQGPTDATEGSSTWPWVAGFWLAAAVAGTVTAVLRSRAWGTGTSRSTGGVRRGPRRTTGLTAALVWGTALAALAAVVRRPDPDDLFYVNLAQWVADNGRFPLRDTMFSDLAFPMASWPPVASYDALAGTVARLTGEHAGSIVYLVVPPLGTFLAVLALWRLLRSWRVAAVGTALSLALVFLLFGGGPGYAAPGNLFLTRMFQGKVVFLCWMVPTLLVYALRYVERPSRSRALWLAVGSVAAVGLTTSAMFLVPLVAVAGAAPLVPRARRAAVAGLATMAAYPLGAGLVTVLVGGRSADDFDSRRLFRFDPEWFGPEILRHGWIAAVAVVAVLLGALLIPHVAGRVTTGVSAVLLGLTFVPGTTQVVFELLGLGPTLWRVSWITPIAGLVGVAGYRVGEAVARGLPGRWPAGVGAGTAALVAAALVVSGVPIWSAENEAALATAPQWKRPPQDMETTEQLLAVAEPGDVVLAPRSLAITLAITTSEVKTVVTRDYFMDYLRDDPDFRFRARLRLHEFVNDLEGEYTVSPLAERSLDILDVDWVCLPLDARWLAAELRALGYESVVTSSAHRCLGR